MAAASACRQHGPAGVSVAEVVSRAGVSRRTFYEIFSGREQCLGAVLDEALERAAASVLPAWRGQQDWCEAMRAALHGLLVFLEQEPTLGVFLLVDALGAGERALRRRSEILEAAIDAVDRGREHSADRERLSRLTAEGVVGGVLGILHARLSEGGYAVAEAQVAGKTVRGGTQQRPVSVSMVGLLGELTAIVVLPYLGPTAAAREAAKPLPGSPPPRPAPQRDALRGLGVRLTYRTAMVINAIAEHPGASNRQVAVHAGVTDPGQISKLLARLTHAGLIHNTTGGHQQGPNAWQLTSTGSDIEHAIKDAKNYHTPRRTSRPV